ncbi:MAG: hypothetical protein ACR2M4_13995 [Actinomycetota bacterium]
MSDKCLGKRVDPRIAFEFTFSELRQFMIVTFGKVFANLAELFFDNMKIVDQPLSRR